MKIQRLIGAPARIDTMAMMPSTNPATAKGSPASANGTGKYDRTTLAARAMENSRVVLTIRGGSGGRAGLVVTMSLSR